MVNRAEDYAWSAPAHCGLRAASEWLDLAPFARGA